MRRIFRLPHSVLPHIPPKTLLGTVGKPSVAAAKALVFARCMPTSFYMTRAYVVLHNAFPPDRQNMRAYAES